jgi:hypothetical protein
MTLDYLRQVKLLYHSLFGSREGLVIHHFILPSFNSRDLYLPILHVDLKESCGIGEDPQNDGLALQQDVLDEGVSGGGQFAAGGLDDNGGLGGTLRKHFYQIIAIEAVTRVGPVPAIKIADPH